MLIFSYWLSVQLNKSSINNAPPTIFRASAILSVSDFSACLFYAMKSINLGMTLLGVSFYKALFHYENLVTFSGFISISLLPLSTLKSLTNSPLLVMQTYISTESQNGSKE